MGRKSCLNCSGFNTCTNPYKKSDNADAVCGDHRPARYDWVATFLKNPNDCKSEVRTLIVDGIHLGAAYKRLIDVFLNPTSEQYDKDLDTNYYLVRLDRMF